MQVTTKLFSILLVGLLSISGQSCKAMQAETPRRKSVAFAIHEEPREIILSPSRSQGTPSHRRSQTAGAALESARPEAIASEEPTQSAEPSLWEAMWDREAMKQKVSIITTQAEERTKQAIRNKVNQATDTLVFGRPGGIISVAEAAPVVGAWYFAEPLSRALNGLSSGISYLWNMGSEPVVTRTARLLEDAAEETVVEPVKRTIRQVSPSAIKTVAAFAGAGIALHNYSKSEKGQAIIEAVKRSGLETRQAVAREGLQRRLELQQAEERLQESIATRASSEELGTAERRIGQRITDAQSALQTSFDTVLSRTKTELELAAEKRHQETQARIKALKEAQERDQRDAVARHAEVTASIAGVRSDVTSGFAAVAQRDAQRSEADKARDQRLEAMHATLKNIDLRSQQEMQQRSDVFAFLGSYLRKRTDAA